MVQNVQYFQLGCKLLDLVVGGDKHVYGVPGGRIWNLCGDKGSGKAQPLYSKVLTPNGWKTMGDIKVGDKVIGLKGKPVDVIGVYPQGKRPIYEFEFQDHTTVRSADSHLWRVQTPNQHHDKTVFGKGKGFSIVSTQEIVDDWESIKSVPARRIYIPRHEPVEFTEKNLPINPWLMGILISDGSLTEAEKGNVSFTNCEEDIIEKAKNIVSSMNNLQISSFEDKSSKAITHRLISKDNSRTEISRQIVALGLNTKSIEKHIPKEYLTSSISQRIELLRGLFDGDGCFSKGGHAEYYTSSEQLKDDIAELVRSLGGMAICRKKTSPFYLKNGKRVYCNDSWTITIYLDDMAWVSSSKKHEEKLKKAINCKKSNWKWEHAKLLNDVRYIGEEECQCIYLADQDHCYITDGNTVTHNTYLCNEAIAWAHYILGDKFKWMYADCERGYSFDTQKMYGFDIHTEDSDAPETVEEAFYCITKFAKSLKDDEFGIYVLDSLDALTSQEQDERAEERIDAIENGKEMKGTYGMGKAKYLSQEFFPQLCKTLENKNILLIIVSQIRDNVQIGSFEKYTRAGGKALDFYSSLITWLATAKKITVKDGDKDVPIGGTNKIKVTKGKVPRPFREGFYTFYYSMGIDNVTTGVDYLFDIRTKTGDISAPAAKCCAWENDPNKKPMSGPEVRQWLIDNKWFDDYKQSKYYPSNGRYSFESALEYINADKDKKKLFDETFSLAMERDMLIKYIYDNGLEEELNKRVEEKWEAFEDSLLKAIPNQGGKYAKFYANQPMSTDEDVII